MKWNNIAFISLLVTLVVVYGFANWKNQYKKVHLATIEFEEVTDFFIQDEDVYKLLIQSKDSINFMTKENVNLKVMESNLIANEMIKSAEVYLDVNGSLGAEIAQRKPILRFYDDGFQYLDDEGKIMPLSSYFSARVPIAFGLSATQAPRLFPLADAFQKDEFYKTQITSIQHNKNGTVYLTLRDADFIVDFGVVQHIDLKLANFKAFYTNAKKEQKLNDYSKVDLQFGKQVVCTKK